MRTLPPVSERRPSLPYPAVLLLGNVAFIAAWIVVLKRPEGWQVVGPVLLALFLVLRVGGVWRYAKNNPDPTGRAKRSAVISTVLALLAVALWVFTLLSGPR
ncbi:hypothetical protein OV207_15290 [Corallococcus sp. BB11-1]|uniref:hypothetical protein n=1 Tax=Corallococcus sp. BB11-1 TaxID=2996783 RepID=UPI00226DA07A|nr:hypothetical protein [Corallococcus sp. BB11-1]MCY1032833.1 hypothetical protein [Corallococcus sp. BB11-1]